MSHSVGTSPYVSAVFLALPNRRIRDVIPPAISASLEDECVALTVGRRTAAAIQSLFRGLRFGSTYLQRQLSG